MLKAALLFVLTICCSATLLRAQSTQPSAAKQPPVASVKNVNDANLQTDVLPKAVPKPNVRYLDLGRSTRGRAITATVIEGTEKRVIIVGGIHGDEPSSAVLAKALIATLSRDPLASNPTIIIVPEANPDGLALATRMNAAGVDINRNFPSTSWQADYPDERHYPGKEPASEPETRALINLIKTHPPDLLITLHAALGCMNWDGPGAEVATMMARINAYPLCGYLGYETPGSFGTYAGTDQRIPTVTIELRDAPDGELVSENLSALRAAITQVIAAEATPKVEPKPE